MSDNENSLFNQSLEKGLAVLRGFNASNRTMNLAEVAEAADITKSSAQRMIHTLEALGYVSKHPQTKRFQLTPQVMEIGYNYLAADTLVDVANPFLAELAQTTGETTNLTEPVRTDMLYVARFVGPKFIPIHLPIGSRIPMYCTASGRAFLSALSDDEVLELLQGSDLSSHTQYTRTSLEEILAEIAEIRRKGYAINSEELFLGDMAVAAPVRNSQGRPVASVHVVAPTSRWTREDAERRLAPAAIECARAISTSIRTL
ncbi:IclR family transcriptional regulator [Pseudomonas sp. LABIM340]|jgi:DNA-binding IclR family transcriptional regulator|uniref:IclR family transcriptional regulator n=1 Tax=Pseudomonas TaxID=286 RepID=UPI00209C820B|nr:IclR family transcriptional regulator [Pseudomonas nitroreducens]MCP1625199.1 DNA-binding IclR family transcriptional regulator [Pseudomonas nitroreducens]